MAVRIENALATLMAHHFGAGTIDFCRQLSGGASMESWSFDFAGAGYILRRAPNMAMMANKPFDHATEAALVQTAHDCAVTAPEVVLVLKPSDDLGSGYIMRRIKGEVSPAAILDAPNEGLIDSIASELAAIHAVDPAKVSDIPAPTTTDLLADLERQFHEFGGNRPVIALALKWCRDNIPASTEPRLVHGDFRIGNLMVAEGQVTGVLDWELAHFGDPHEDLAWGCVGAWRFGNYDRPAFGLVDYEHYFTAYERAGGGPVDRNRFRYWLIHRTIWWALGCLQMGATWRGGIDRSLERAAIARRTIENEIDLLLMLEEDAPQIECTPVVSKPSDKIERKGETSTAELLEAVGEWIATEIKPVTEGRNRFLSAVAMNSLKIAMRNIEQPVEMEDRATAVRLLSGEVDLATPDLLGQLRKTILRKGINDAPKYAGLAAALEKWT